MRQNWRRRLPSWRLLLSLPGRWAVEDASGSGSTLRWNGWRWRTKPTTMNCLPGLLSASETGSMDRRLELLDKFSTVHLLVIGDLMLDRFIWGDVERLSPEAPVPVLRVVSENASLGGAANVVQNIRALGGRVTACGIVGRDDPGKRVLHALR